MSSIRTIQTERLLQDVVRILYSSGRQPMLDEIMTQISKHFSAHPAGRPLHMPLEDIVSGMVSDTNKYNKLLKHIAVNVDVLYETSLRQVEDILMLTSSMQTDLERLKKKRRRIETRLDDFMLAQNNTDGYFYSVSDNFSDLDYTNLNLTSAEINTEVGIVILPTVSSSVSKLPRHRIGTPSIAVSVDGKKSDYVELAPFSGAIEDSLDNIVWAFEVESRENSEVIAEVTIRLGDLDPVELSRVDLKPYGATPVQVFMETREPMPQSSSGSAVSQVMPNWKGFGSKISTGTTKMIFGDSAQQVRDIKITLRKTEADYTENKNGNLRYKYIFGAKELAFIYQVYERNARFVSQPLVIPSEYMGDMVIDAVSLSAEVDVPGDCTLRYYVAPSDLSEFEPHHSGEGDDLEHVMPSEPGLNDYIWHEIVPIDSNEPGDKIIRFNGALTGTVMITEDPAAGDLQLEPIVETGPIRQRNPTPTIIPGVDIYRIASVGVNPLNNSISLLEGINTTRIYSKNIDNSTPFIGSSSDPGIDISYWSEIMDDHTDELTLDYGRIDTGNGFFYGGDVGAVGKDVYIETYLYADSTWSTFLSEFQKSDARSRTWDVKVFLNGRPIGTLPVGTDKMQLPWNFKQGLNHILLLVRIPLTSGISDPYMGIIRLFNSGNLFDYGSVHLSKWEYVDLFTMKYNESGSPRTFTIHEDTIISRRKPTTNFQLRYSEDTGDGPVAVLFRADMTRSRNNSSVTPELSKYRLRFSYAED